MFRTRRVSNAKTPRFNSRFARTRLWLTALEERAVPATFTVINNLDAGAGSLREALTLAQNNAQDDTITFDTGLVTSPIGVTSGELLYLAPSTEGKTLKITWPGAGKLTIQSSGAASVTRRVFNLSDAHTTTTSVAITLENLVITGGNLSSGNGAGISTTNESLTLTNCDVTGNTSGTAGGGIAVSAATSTITFNSCTISNNKATTTGGALMLSAAGTITINSGTTFSNNTASSTGGAIHSSSTTTFNITSATFSGNSATSTGGAIHSASSTTFTINTSTFSGNSTGASGGAINTASTVTFNCNDSTIANNVAATGGGGIRFSSSSSTVTLNRCTVSGNTALSTASGHGGGLYMFIGGSLTVNESTVSNNVAFTTGGGIASFSATVTLTNSTVSGNEARGTAANQGGGGISLNSSASLVINNSTITNNKATGAVNGSGGGIRRTSTTGTVTLQSSIVAANTSTTNGPDINNSSTVTLAIAGGDNLVGVDDLGNFTLAGANKTGNSATPLDPRLATLANNGGTTLTHGFRFDSMALNNGNIVSGKTFDQRGSPFARVLGGTADVGAIEGQLTVPFVDGTMGIADVSVGGGTTYGFTVTFNDETGIDTTKLGTGEVTVTGPAGFFSTTPTFLGFTVGVGNKIDAKYEFTSPGGTWDTMDGGAYSVNLVAAKLFDTDAVPQSAPAGVVGTFTVGVAGGIVVDTAADGDDGNVSLGNISLREAVRISNSSFNATDTITFNSALMGSTITLTGGQLDVSDGVDITGLGSTKLTISGTAGKLVTNRIFSLIVANTVATFNISGLTLTNADTTGAGGAVVIADETANFTDVAFVNNKSTGVGAGVAGTNLILTFNNCSFTGNSATGNGGAIALNTGAGNTLTITNSTFTNNTTAGGGGAIQGGSTITLNVIGSSFTGNVATTTGGAMNVGAGNVTIGTTTFSNNVSAGGGALAFPSANVTVTINNASFTGNTTTGTGTGAAINASSTITLTVDDSTFSNNAAAATGGAIRMTSLASTVTLNRCTLSGNTGTGGGGVYFLAAGELNINDSTLNNNVASTGGGGGIRIGAGTLNLTNSTVSGNTAATSGGGIRLGVTAATLTVTNSTIANNVATGGKGGGVYFVGNTSTVNFDATIVAGNTGATNRDLGGSLANQNITGTKNLIGAYDSAIVTIDTLMNQFGSEATPLDAKLAPLNNFGGPTKTHGLLSGSPAIDMGSDVKALMTDQRGTGFPRLVGLVTDVGAFEGELKIPSAKATLSNVTTAGGTVYIASVEYTDETAINVASIDLNDVTLTGGVLMSPLSPTMKNVSGAGMIVTVTYEFTPPGGSWDFFDGGIYTLNMIASQVFDTDGPNAVLDGSLGTFTVSIPQTLVVDNINDEDDTDYSAGDFSLREAVRLANTASPGGTDTITFAPALNGGTISLLTGHIAITDGVIIQGPGAGLLSVAGAVAASATNRIFNVNIAAIGATVTMSGLTLTAGNVTGVGGAIAAVDEILAIMDVTFSGNKSSTSGGAINVSGAASISLTNCTFTGNSATTTGGGISMPATATTSAITVTNSTFTNNTATTSGGAINGGSTVTFNVSGSTFTTNKGSGGGAIFTTANAAGSTISSSNFTGNVSTSSGGTISTSGTGGTLSITDSTISGGSASSNGGAINFPLGTLSLLRTTIANNVSSGTGGGAISASNIAAINITDSTISGNTVTGSTGGGAMYTGGAVTIVNSTISGNAASGALVQGGGAIRAVGGSITIDNSTITGNSVGSGNGGGINMSAATVVVTITSSIVAQNIGTNHPDVFSNTTIGMNVTVTDSIIGADTDSDVTLTLNGTSVAGTLLSPINAKLQGLANNGGPTLTHALSLGSPALDMGSNSITLTNDQRGTGFPRTLNAITDIGAFEGVGMIPQGFASAIDVTTAGGTSHTVVVNYTDDVSINTGSIDVGDITITTPGGASIIPSSVMVSGSGNNVNATYTFIPPGGTWDLFDNGTYKVNILANQVFDNNGVPNAVPAGQAGTFKVNIAGPVSIVVDTIVDELDLDFTPGDVSLRDAIALANATSTGIDTISFAAALTGQKITLSLGEMVISDGLVINGLGAANLTIDANKLSRIFNITDGTATVIPVTISNLTLTGGQAAGGGAIIMAPENVTLSNIVATANTSTTLGGVVWFNTNGVNTLTINNSTLTNNSATGNGGCIGTNGGSNVIAINDSVFTGNKSSASGGCLDTGGGGGTLDVARSSFSGNTATGNGGIASSGYAVFTFTDCTLSGNSANNGGALSGYSNKMNLINCTIANNNATVAGGAISMNRTAAAAQEQITAINTTITGNNAGTGAGGGIRMATTNATPSSFIRLVNSIVSGNTNATAADISRPSIGPYTYINFSAVGSATGFVPAGTNANNIAYGTPLLLGTLSSNGGTMQTIAPMAGSPVINAGDDSVLGAPYSLTTDQRGNGRKFGTSVDIGSFEVNAPTKFSSVVINNGDAQRSMVTQVKVNFNQHIGFTAGAAAAFTLDRVSPTPGSVTLAAAVDDSGSGTAVTLTFTGGAVDLAGSLADGRYALHILANGFNAEGFDGDSDGMAELSPTDDFFFDEPAAPAALDLGKIFRIFGDISGDGSVSGVDFTQFRLSFGGTNFAFDYDGNGAVAGSDFTQFRLRFGGSI